MFVRVATVGIGRRGVPPPNFRHDSCRRRQVRTPDPIPPNMPRTSVLFPGDFSFHLAAKHQVIRSRSLNK